MSLVAVPIYGTYEPYPGVYSTGRVIFTATTEFTDGSTVVSPSEQIIFTVTAGVLQAGATLWATDVTSAGAPVDPAGVLVAYEVLEQLDGFDQDLYWIIVPAASSGSGINLASATRVPPPGSVITAPGFATLLPLLESYIESLVTADIAALGQGIVFIPPATGIAATDTANWQSALSTVSAAGGGEIHCWGLGYAINATLSASNFCRVRLPGRGGVLDSTPTATENGACFVWSGPAGDPLWSIFDTEYFQIDNLSMVCATIGQTAPGVLIDSDTNPATHHITLSPVYSNTFPIAIQIGNYDVTTFDGQCDKVTISRLFLTNMGTTGTGILIDSMNAVDTSTIGAGESRMTFFNRGIWAKRSGTGLEIGPIDFGGGEGTNPACIDISGTLRNVITIKGLEAESMGTGAVDIRVNNTAGTGGDVLDPIILEHCYFHYGIDVQAGAILLGLGNRFNGGTITLDVASAYYLSIAEPSLFNAGAVTGAGEWGWILANNMALNAGTGTPSTNPGLFQTQGSGAGYQFKDRTGANLWEWYGTASIARLFSGAIDAMMVDGAGNVTATGHLAGTALVLSGPIFEDQSAAAAAVATNGTITTSGVGVARVAPTGAVTGVILQAGATAGQRVTVVNESANLITFAASGSNVADGATSAIAAKTARSFVWDSSTSLWYRFA